MNYFTEQCIIFLRLQIYCYVLIERGFSINDILFEIYNNKIDFINFLKLSV